MLQPVYSAGDEDTFINPSAGERALLAAHLELACRDLLTGSFREINDAVKWFNGHDNNVTRENSFPYLMVVQYLDLGYMHIVKVNHFIKIGLRRRERIGKGGFSKTAKGLFCDKTLSNSRRPRTC